MMGLFGLHPEMLVQPLMYAGIGFLFAALIALALSPAIHRRAERLTRRRLQDSIPASFERLRAEKDTMRARHAVETRDLTLGLDQLREKTALQGAALGRKTEEANRLKLALAEKDNALAELERLSAGIDTGSDGLRAAVSIARFEANTARSALRDAERAIMTLQNEIAELTAAVESRTRLIDRQQHDIMALSAQIEQAGATPDIAAPLAAPPQPAKAAAATPSAPGKVSFESRLAAIRDDKPLRDVRPHAVVKRAAGAPAANPLLAPPVTKSAFLNSLIAQAQAAKAKATQKPAASQTPPAAPTETAPARVSTDIRYDEPLTTSELLELGKAMLRQPAKDGPPHKTH